MRRWKGTRIGLALLVAAGTVGMTGGFRSLPVSASVTSLTLSASPNPTATGQAVTLTATANADVGSAFIDIFRTNDGSFVGSCFGGRSCQGSDTRATPGTYTYRAYVDTDFTAEYPPTGIIVQSSTVTVTWEVPSTFYCPSPTIPIVVDPGPPYVKIVAQTGATQVALCTRFVEAGVVAGGALVVQTSLNGILPSTDGNVAACTNVLANPTVDGVTILLATGVGPSGETYLCAQVGGTKVRVIIPTTAAPPVAFYPETA